MVSDGGSDGEVLSAESVVAEKALVLLMTKSAQHFSSLIPGIGTLCRAT
jgi:hypothetical protein